MALTQESQKALMDILKVKQPESIAAPLSPYEAMQMERGLLSTDPVIANLQKLGRGVKSLLEPETPMDYLMSGLGPAKAVGKGAKKIGEKISFQKFKELSDKGKMNFARTVKQDKQSLLKKKSKAQDFTPNSFDEQIQYDSGEFTQKLIDELGKKGLYVLDDMYGKVIVGQTKKDAEFLRDANSGWEFGKSYGYTDEDIARFYTNIKGGGDPKRGYEVYLKDL